MRIIFGGDTVPTDLTERAFCEGDTESLFGKAARIFKSADAFFVNLECALTDKDTPIKKIGPAIKASPRCAAGLKALGVTAACLANNHLYDYGEGGYRDTLLALDEAGIPYTGVGENDTESRTPYFFEIEGKRFALINVAEHEYSYALPNRCGVNPFDPFLTMQDIRSASALADYTVVVYHGGKEFCEYPSPRLYNLTHEMVECGADVVLCQHSHCVGCYEKYKNGHIVYGQGNFNFLRFDLSSNVMWSEGLAVELSIEDKDIELYFHPLVSSPELGRVELAEGERAREILGGFMRRSKELENGEWQRGWQEFCRSVSDNYIRVIREAMSTDEHGFEMFKHYLDCEAHSDVWHELLPTYNKTVKQ